MGRDWHRDDTVIPERCSGKKEQQTRCDYDVGEMEPLMKC